VVEAALQSLGSIGDKRTLDVARTALGRDSWEDLMRRAALDALGRLGDEAGIEIAMSYAGPPQPWTVRVEALGAMAAMGADLEPNDPRLDRIRKVCEKRLDDDVIQVRTAAARALGKLGSEKARPALERAAKRDDYPGFLSACRRSLEALGKPETMGTTEGELKQQVSDLNERNRDLESDLKQLRQEVEGLKKKN
jgi:HEAT repeat protein